MDYNAAYEEYNGIREIDSLSMFHIALCIEVATLSSSGWTLGVSAAPRVYEASAYMFICTIS